MTKDLVWIVQKDDNIRQVERNRLDFKWPYNNIKTGYIKLIKRKASAGRGELWEYVYVGETREEAIDYANAYLIKIIQEAEKNLASLKERLIK